MAFTPQRTMALSTRWPNEILDPLETLFSGFAAPFRTMPSTGTRWPSLTPGMLPARLDVIEKPDCYEVKVELPGVRKEDIQVQLEETKNRLSVQAQRQEEKLNEGDRYYVAERSFGVIKRIVEMPYDADPKKIEASFANGMLHLKINKRLAESEPRLVQIKSA